MTTVKTIGLGELSIGAPGAGASVVVVIMRNPPGRISVTVRLLAVVVVMLGSVVDEKICERIVTTGSAVTTSAAAGVVVVGLAVVVKLAAPLFDLNDSKLPTIAASETVSGSSVSSSGSGSVTS